MKNLKSAVVLMLAGIISLSTVTGCSTVTKMLKKGATLDYSQGAWKEENKLYENKSLKMQFEVPEGWTSMSSEQMDQMLESGKQFLSDEQEKQYDSLEKALNHEFVIQKGYESVQFAVENLDLTVKKADMDEKTYIEALKKQLLSAQGVTYSYEDTYKQKIGGKEFTVLPANVNNGAMYQIYALRNEGGYMIQIIATYNSGSEDAIKGILEKNFKELASK
ncbi:hypothetical protein [Anaerosacchariphilus polymeriproducens]|uniref:PsbP C-terminal domain-containing protein n=1 Tax=Anaerosacchariphilus polymeriproducens TaxID=1812858 RepID=A0A371AXA1_9FIRM|nr:hypothetical protein [Anaerosacchariphilus polymeriproducens]RDU24206.1 hypothetical protein DWV06_05775 [Anaerosacchariphilus polymeriproducens]